MIRIPIRPTTILSIAVITAVCATAQTAPTPDPDSTKSDNATLTLDQLLRQNQQLEIQNQQLQKQNEVLIQRIEALRGAGNQNGKASQQDDAALALATTGKNGDGATQASNEKQSTQTSSQNQHQQSPSQNQSDAGDKTEFDKASEGSPAIFGEFNPGRGFVVGRGEHAELSLSGYMVARFLDQMPANQSAIDHFGRPIIVTPGKDFQFHRVMLLSQGWLFSPKFGQQTGPIFSIGMTALY